MYSTESMAEEALISAWIAYDYAVGNGPINIYRCEDCRSWHLTSKGPMNKKLESYLSSGKLNKDREANKWLDRMKRKGKV
jgi:hypothetical protein